jgi:TolB protein
MKELIKGVGTTFDLSADGRRFAFARLSARGTALVVADKDGSRQRTFFESNRSHRLTHLAWSADGTSVACAIEDSTGARLIEISVESGEQKPMSFEAWEKISGICRLPDGRFAVAARRSQSESSQLWAVSSGSEAQKITDDLKDYSSPSPSGDRLIAIQASEISGIVVSLKEETRPSGPITAGRDGRFGVAFAPNGKILFASENETESDIHLMDLDGSDRKRLTSKAAVNRFPSASPDRRYIVFVSTRSGASEVWRMNIDGSEQRQLTRSGRGRALWPQCSSDSKWVVYAMADGRKTTLWKTSVAGGDSIQLTDANSFHPALSPDGKLIAYLTDDGARSSIEIIRFEGRRMKTLEIARGQVNGIRWSADSRALLYSATRDGVSNLWIQPADGSAPRQMTDYKDGLIFSFDVSSDGRWMAISRGEARRDIVWVKR